MSGAELPEAKSPPIDMQVAGVVAALPFTRTNVSLGDRPRSAAESVRAAVSKPNLLRAKRGNGLAQSLTKIGCAGTLGQRVGAQHGDGRGAVGGRHALHARAGHDHGFLTAAIVVLRHRRCTRRRGAAQQQGMFQIELTMRI